MADREKVIKGLDLCINQHKDCNECAYHNETFCADVLMCDALDLLKEQEPVAPIMVPHSRGIAYKCGSCGTEIAVVRDTVSAKCIRGEVRYCRVCGGAVKWDDSAKI